jgi:hypothetical protein
MHQSEGGPHRFEQTARCIWVLAAILVVLATIPQVWSGSLNVIAITLVDGKPHGSALTLSGGRTPVLRLRQGDAVELRWSSDRSMALHLHGYNLEMQAAPGADTIMSFNARFAGRFPVETHNAQGRHRVILYVEVHPQ